MFKTFTASTVSHARNVLIAVNATKLFKVFESFALFQNVCASTVHPAVSAFNAFFFARFMRLKRLLSLMCFVS